MVSKLDLLFLVSNAEEKPRWPIKSPNKDRNKKAKS